MKSFAAAVMPFILVGCGVFSNQSTLQDADVKNSEGIILEITFQQALYEFFKLPESITDANVVANAGKCEILILENHMKDVGELEKYRLDRCPKSGETLKFNISYEKLDQYLKSMGMHPKSIKLKIDMDYFNDHIDYPHFEVNGSRGGYITTAYLDDVLEAPVVNKFTKQATELMPDGRDESGYRLVFAGEVKIYSSNQANAEKLLKLPNVHTEVVELLKEVEDEFKTIKAATDYYSYTTPILQATGNITNKLVRLSQIEEKLAYNLRARTAISVYVRSVSPIIKRIEKIVKENWIIKEPVLQQVKYFEDGENTDIRWEYQTDWVFTRK